MFARILEYPVHHRLLAVVWLAALSMIALGGALQLKIDTSYDSLISERDPGKAAYNETVALFGSDNTTIIYVKSRDLFDPDRLLDLEDTVAALEEIDGVEGVDSLFSVVNIRDRDGVLDSGPLMDVAPDTIEDAVRIREDAIYSPLVRRNLLSPDGKVTAINVTVIRDMSDARFNHRVHAEIEKALEPIRDRFDVMLQVGPPRLNVEIEKSMFADLTILTPLSTTVLVICIIILMRVPVAALIPMMTAGTSIFWTFGFMGYMDLKLTLLTAIVPSLIIVIGSTEDMHLMAGYLEGVSEGEKDKSKIRKVAVRIMSKHIGAAIFLSAFTTAAGFFSNAVNEIPLIRDFAFASSFGMIANLVCTVLMVPVLLGFFGPKSNPLKADEGAEHDLKGIMGVLVRLVEWLVEKHGRTVAIVVGGTVFVFAVLAVRVHVSNDPLSYFPDDHPLVLDADTLHRDLSGMQVFYVTLDGGEENAFREPDNLKKLEAVVAELKTMKVFDKVIGVSDHLSLVNQEMHDARPEYWRVPDTRNLVDQYLLMFQRSDLERYVSADYRYANIIVRHNISDSHELNGYLDTVQGYLSDILGITIAFRLTGENLMINRAAEGLFSGQAQSLVLIGGIIFVLMSFMYTSVFAGVMFLIPNMIPVLMNFGAMVLMGIPLNPGTASVAAIALGIAVDDSIHLFTRFRNEIRNTGDPEKAAQITVRGEAVAVITTSISLMIMYSTLMLSNFAIVAQFGLLAGLTMMYALVADLLITPMILRRVGLVSVFEIVTLKLAAEVIKESPLFQGMSRWQVKKTILLSKTARFEPGEAIIVEGEVDENLFVVLSGQVGVYRKVDDQEMFIVAVGPGQVFGEIAFVAKTERTASVKAVTEAEVLILDAEGTRKALRSYSSIAAKLYRNLSRILGEKLFASTEQLVAQSRDAASSDVHSRS